MGLWKPIQEPQRQTQRQGETRRNTAGASPAKPVWPQKPCHLSQAICSSSLCSGWTHRNLFKNSLAHTHKHSHKNRIPAKHLAGLEVLPALRQCLRTRVAKQRWSEAPPSSTVCQQSQLFQLTFLQLQLLQPLPVSLRGNSSLLKLRTVFLSAVPEACSLDSQYTVYYTDLPTTPENQDGVSWQLPILRRLGQIYAPQIPFSSPGRDRPSDPGVYERLLFPSKTPNLTDGDTHFPDSKIQS